MIVFSDTTPRGDTGEERSWSGRRLPDANIYSSVLIERTVVALSLHRVTFCAINIVHVYMSSTTVDKWTLGTETTITMLLDMEVRASKKKYKATFAWFVIALLPTSIHKDDYSVAMVVTCNSSANIREVKN